MQGNSLILLQNKLHLVVAWVPRSSEVAVAASCKRTCSPWCGTWRAWSYHPNGQYRCKSRQSKLESQSMSKMARTCGVLRSFTSQTLPRNCACRQGTCASWIHLFESRRLFPFGISPPHLRLWKGWRPHEPAPLWQEVWCPWALAVAFSNQLAFSLLPHHLDSSFYF